MMPSPIPIFHGTQCAKLLEMLDRDTNFIIKTMAYKDPNFIQNITPDLVERFDEYDQKLDDIYPTKY